MACWFARASSASGPSASASTSACRASSPKSSRMSRSMSGSSGWRPGLACAGSSSTRAASITSSVWASSRHPRRRRPRPRRARRRQRAHRLPTHLRPARRRPARERGRRLTAVSPLTTRRLRQFRSPDVALTRGGLPAAGAPATMRRPPTRRATLGHITEESRVPTVRETVAEMVQYVFPQYAGAPGQIYGGRMMDWIATAGTLAASRVARGPVAVGAMDEIDFLHPVRVGGIAILRARGEYVGRTSLEVGVRVYSENPATGERHATLSSHMAFVAIDETPHPRPVGARIVPADATEAGVVEAARARREARRARLVLRTERAREVTD